MLARLFGRTAASQALTRRNCVTWLRLCRVLECGLRHRDMGVPIMSKLAPEDPRDARIRKLEDELFVARQTVLSLVPAPFRSLLDSYHQPLTRGSAYGWRHMVVEKILEGTVPLGDEARPDLFGFRACCPLCGRGSQSPYQEGFAYPEGLRRHLIGFGRTHQCSVMETVMALARESWNRQFAPGEAAELTLKSQEEGARRSTETLFMLGPKESPVLADERLYWGKARVTDGADFSLKWAEQRLFGLGFQVVLDDRKKSYTKSVKHPNGDFVVYADPRQTREILFRVFDAAVVRGKKAGMALSTFTIRDSWKNNLPEKVAAGVESAANVTRR